MARSGHEERYRVNRETKRCAPRLSGARAAHASAPGARRDDPIEASSTCITALDYAVRETGAFLAADASIERVIFAVFSEGIHEVYREALGRCSP